MSLIDFEIEEVSKLCENVIHNSRLVTCVKSLVGTLGHNKPYFQR